MKHVLLLTGRPGVGKTTIMQRLAASLSDMRLGGFYTREIREAGVRRGFELVDFAGHVMTLAHVGLPSHWRIGKYGVDLQAFEQRVAALLRSDAAEVFLIDEIGRMECLSDVFVAAVRALVDAGRPLVATVAASGGGLIREIKAHPAAELWQVTTANREHMPAKIRTWLDAHAS